MKHLYPLYLASQAHETASTLTVTQKFTQETLTQVACADTEVVEQAIQAGVTALPAMRALKPYQKQTILRQCASAFHARFDELVDVLVAEAGKPRAAAIGEVKRLINTFELTADAVTTLHQGEVIPLAVTEAAGSYRGMTQQVPIGLCAFITPFNFPLNLVAHKIAPAIAAGCPFILKPASATPVSALLLGKILAETDLPEGAFSILPMPSSIGDALVTDARIKLLSFTGSDVVGWDMKARAGKKKVVLELGGNAAVMLEPDADLDVALTRIITGAYAYAGQVCISVQRVLVHDSLYGEVKDKLINLAKAVHVGNPNDDVLVGPMISKKELTRALDWVTDATTKGASLLCGGTAEGLLMQPTILENVATDAHYAKDEAFAPVMVLERYSDFASGIAQVNASRFGLQVGVFTQNLTNALSAWDEIDAGGVVINDTPTFRVDNMPYGGVKDSGFGREGIRYAIDDMSETRLLVIKR